MADSKTFVLVGNFQDNITPALNGINKTLDSVKRNLGGFSSKKGGFDDLTKSMGKVVSAHKHLNEEVKSLQNNIRSTIPLLREYRSEAGKAISANMRLSKTGSLAAQMEAKHWAKALELAKEHKKLTDGMKSSRATLRGAPTRRTTGEGASASTLRPSYASDRAPARGGNLLGDFVVGGVITQAIVSGFQIGVGIMQKGINAAFGAVAERTRDQLEDIASAGGIFSAAKFAKAEGLPKTFQGALDLQDDINKKVATIASNLPGTTQDFVMNARRMTDTLARIMSDDAKGFLKLAQELTGDRNITGEKAFAEVNVEVAKATTLLEKLNPARTVVPMTQIVEDMMKAEEVTVAGLRKYVSFRRATTFESALTRNLGELNKAGAGTADRLKMIMKVLKEAVPPELIAAMTTSVSGVIEGFRSALLDPDVGLFGLSRTLSFEVVKFNRDTGKPMVDKFGNIIKDTTNFFKVFSEIFGNLGNLLNSAIMPGLAALYSPFESLTKGLLELRDKSWKIFERQQTYNAYFSKLAESRGMSVGAFKSAEKAGVATVLELMAGFKIIDKKKADSYLSRMEKGGSDKEIAAEMQGIYKDIIPMFLNSPFIKDLGKNIGSALATIFKEIANLMDTVLHFKGAGASEFVDAFVSGGGLDSINRIVVYLAEGLGKIIQSVVGIFLSSLGKAITSGNLGAAAVLGVVGFTVIRSILGDAIMTMIRNVMGKCTQITESASCPTPGGGAAGRGRRGKRGGGGASPFLTESGGRTARRAQAYSRLQRMRAKKYLTEPVVQAPRTIRSPQFPQVALGTEPTPLTRAQRRQQLVQRAARAPGRAARGIQQRVGAASMAPTMQAARGMAGGAGRGLARAGRFVPGGALAFGALDAGMRMASGQDAGKAIGGAAASTIGATLGGILGQALIPVPGLGAAVGMAAGGFLGDSIFNAITGPASEQKQAAQMQLQAAQQRMQTQTESYAGITQTTSQPLQYFYGSVDELRKKLEYAGYANDQNARALLNEYTQRNVSLEQYKITQQKLASFTQTLDATRTPSQAQAQRLAELNAAVARAKVAYEKEQKELNAKFAQTPQKITNAIVNSIQTGMSTAQIDAAIARRIEQARVSAGIGARQDARTTTVTPGSLKPGATNTGGSAGGGGSRSSRNTRGGGQTGYAGRLGDAISTEMRMKPPGSDLVIANSSETIIPAANGNNGTGMLAFVETLRSGFSAMVSSVRSTAVQTERTLNVGFNSARAAYIQAQQKQESALSKINQTLVLNQQQTNTRLSRLETKFTTPGLGGAMPSGGGVDAFNPVARQYGLTMTSGYRPGDPGWHGANRARDYSNGTGPTVQMLQFAKFMASTYGRNLKELIYTPLGFSIKNGQQVAPYAQGSHYNHVHVAYGLGAGNPAFFSSAAAADKWETAMARREPIVSSVRATASELGGGNYTVNAPITITQQPGQDPDTLASLVVMKLSMAIDEIRNHTA